MVIETTGFLLIAPGITVFGSETEADRSMRGVLGSQTFYGLCACKQGVKRNNLCFHPILFFNFLLFLKELNGSHFSIWVPYLGSQILRTLKIFFFSKIGISESRLKFIS